LGRVAGPDAKSQWDGTADKESALVAVFAHVGGCVFGMIVGIGQRLFGKPPKRHSE